MKFEQVNFFKSLSVQARQAQLLVHLPNVNIVKLNAFDCCKGLKILFQDLLFQCAHKLILLTEQRKYSQAIDVCCHCSGIDRFNNLFRVYYTFQFFYFIEV